MFLGEDMKWFSPVAGREDSGEVELLLPVTWREWQLPGHGGAQQLHSTVGGR